MTNRTSPTFRRMHLLQRVRGSELTWGQLGSSHSLKKVYTAKRWRSSICHLFSLPICVNESITNTICLRKTNSATRFFLVRSNLWADEDEEGKQGRTFSLKTFNKFCRWQPTGKQWAVLTDQLEHACSCENSNFCDISGKARRIPKSMGSHFPLPKNVSPSLFPLFQMARAARRVIENPRQMIKSCPVLYCSSHRKNESN